MCAFLPDAEAGRFIERVQAIAHGSETVDAKAAALQTLLPKARTFGDFHSALCLPAGATRVGLPGVSELSSWEFYYLLDTIAPIAVSRQVTNRAAGRLTEAPRLLAPPDSTVFDVYPRSTQVQWGPVDGAASYLVEVELQYPPPDGFRPAITETGQVTIGTAATFDFDGATWGRWRIRALDNWGRPGPVSEWRYFRYLR